jgi:hypothetical protein
MVTSTRPYGHGTYPLTPSPFSPPLFFLGAFRERRAPPPTVILTDGLTRLTYAVSYQRQPATKKTSIARHRRGRYTGIGIRATEINPKEKCRFVSGLWSCYFVHGYVFFFTQCRLRCVATALALERKSPFEHARTVLLLVLQYSRRKC